MHLEQKIEKVIAAAMTAGMTGLISGVSVSVRTYWDEQYSTKEAAAVTMPCVFIMASPSSRETLEDPERTVPVDVMILTQSQDDFSRRQISSIYSKARHLCETTEFNFGSLVQYGGATFDSPGESGTDDETKRNFCFFQMTLHLCAESSEAHA